MEVIPPACFYTDETRKTKGLTAEYFDNAKLEGTPRHTRIDDHVDFEWWTTPPFSDMSYERFSVRWKGVLVPPASGEYALGGEAFRGFKLMLD